MMRERSVSRPPRAWAALAAVASILPALYSCGSSGGAGAGEFAVSKTYSSGSNSVTLRVSRDRITAADSVEVELIAEAPEETQIVFPTFEGKLGEFTIADRATSDARLVDDNRIEQRATFELEPFLPGEYEVPNLTVLFGEEKLETEAQKVVVESVLPDRAQTPDIKEIAPPVGLPGVAAWVWIAGGVLAAGVAAFVWWRRRRRPGNAAPELLPHEAAMRALRELMAEDLLARGEAKLLYLKVSAILRHYIEGRFGMHAPERTTEEFLRDLRNDSQLAEPQKKLLRDFLRHCDMVKFAEYAPTVDEVNQTLNTCAQFIAETRPRETGATMSPAAATATGGGS